MKVAIGLSVHTGWAACVVAAGSLHEPSLQAREHVELRGDPERFVFHRAAEMPRTEAARWVDDARRDVVARASRVLRRLKERDVSGCAIVAKAGAMPPLDEILASHPRIHTAEGLFYRDALSTAAEANGLRVTLVPPDALDVKDARVVEAGRVVGKPWDRDWKLASLAAWRVLARAA